MKEALLILLLILAISALIGLTMARFIDIGKGDWK